MNEIYKFRRAFKRYQKLKSSQKAYSIEMEYDHDDDGIIIRTRTQASTGEDPKSYTCQVPWDDLIKSENDPLIENKCKAIEGLIKIIEGD